MKRNRQYIASLAAIGFSVAAILTACGGGGGSSGSGTDASTTVIQGNISDQVAALAISKPTLYAKLQRALTLIETAQAAVSGVQVSVRNTGLSTVSDEDGFFRIEGNIGGEIVLDFTLPDATLSLGITCPPGSQVMLQNVSLNRTAGTATPQSTDISGNDSPRDIAENGNSSDDDDNANTNANINSNTDDDDNANSNSNGNEDEVENENENENGDDRGGIRGSGGSDSGSGSNSGSGGGNSGQGGGSDDNGGSNSGQGGGSDDNGGGHGGSGGGSGDD